MSTNGTHLTPTPASQWRKPSAEEAVKLPSGNVAVLRTVQPVNIIRNDGSIPPAVQNLLLSGGDQAKIEKIIHSNLSEAVEILFYLAPKIFVYPRLVDGEPQGDDEVDVADPDIQDLSYAVSWAFARLAGNGEVPEAIQVERFPEQPEGSVSTVSSGEDVRQKSRRRARRK